MSEPAGHGVVGREREAELLEAALASGANVVLEGPPGTGKSTLLRRVAERRHTPFVLVEGNSELTPSRLIGHHDPALVLSRGYDPEVFVDGPLLAAMREGALLYVEELNRVPEETLNALLAAMSEREIVVPRLGAVAAKPGFGVVAAMNPYDAVGTARVASAVYDRTCRIAMGYQSEAAERRIVALRTGLEDDEWCAQVVALVRATRSHAELRVGSSIRGGIDLVGLARELARVRGVPLRDWATGLDAALVALSGRVRVEESAGRTAEEIVTDLYRSVFRADDGADDGSGQEAEPGSERSPGER